VTVVGFVTPVNVNPGRTATRANVNPGIEGERGREHFVDRIAGADDRSTKCWL
jgi:hypothetical protein